MGVVLKTNKKMMKIVAAASVAIFSLFAVVLGTYAWFSASLLSQISNDDYQVVRVARGGELESVNFIKFEYPYNAQTRKYDYSNGKDGEVRKYTLQDGVFVDSEGHTTSTMTTYDPAEKIIFGDSFSLFDTNCAAFYEVTLSSGSYGDFTLDISGFWKSDTPKRLNRDIFLTDCADFCVFTTSDISTSIGVDPDTNKPYYYPKYKEESETLSDLENLYYRLSYQSSLKTDSQLSHFYPAENETQKHSEIELASNLPVTFTEQNSTFTVYVCVNYAPDQLEAYYKDIYLSDISAIFDYYFSFTLTEVED